jgi:hypothetical protein
MKISKRSSIPFFFFAKLRAFLVKQEIRSRGTNSHVRDYTYARVLAEVIGDPKTFNVSYAVNPARLMLGAGRAVERHYSELRNRNPFGDPRKKAERLMEAVTEDAAYGILIELQPAYVARLLPKVLEPAGTE